MKAGRVVDAAHHKILGDEMHDARERAAAKGPPPLSGRADGRIRASTITQRGAAASRADDRVPSALPLIPARLCSRDACLLLDPSPPAGPVPQRLSCHRNGGLRAVAARWHLGRAPWPPGHLSPTACAPPSTTVSSGAIHPYRALVTKVSSFMTRAGLVRQQHRQTGSDRPTIDSRHGIAKQRYHDGILAKVSA
ncbi:hypothetical protein B2J93_321 [Marssonina coronariae]|uniref:Uncharacterized protein n=1 Tax=Diplocarpon coronariae TaxID=2795749 RepID=A0A218Z186_9HELO|nr:hypothetical protein B2J93_321 [Marssonina coronariae]